MSKMTRIGLAAVASMAMLAVAGCAPSGDSAESTVLNVTLANHGWSETIMERVGEFEKATGVTVEFNTYGEQQLSEQYNVKLNAGDDNIDVMMYRPPSETQLFSQNGWLQDITERVESDSEWDWNDFKESTRTDVSFDGVVYAVPLVTEQQVLYYRKDLLEAAGIEVPTTLDELRAAAAALHNPDEVYGFVARGKQFSQTAPILHSFGADWFDEDGATLNTPEAIAAYEWYGGMLRDFGPEGTTSMGWPEAIAIFAQGKAAFYLDANVLYTNLTDASKSTVSDTVGFAVVPAGPEGSKPYNVTSWGLGINPNSKNQDTAWEFIRWATSQQMVLDLQQKGLLGARASVWEDPAGLTGIPEQLALVTQESVALDGGRDRPQVVQVARALEIYGQAVTAAILGEDVKAAADKANEEFDVFLQDEERRK